MKGPGFFTNGFKLFDFEYAVETLGDLGYRGIELWCKGQFFVPGRDGEARAEKLVRLADASGMEVFALSAHLDFVSPNDDLREASVERFKRVIDAAPLFDVDRVVTASGYLHGRRPSEEMGERLLESMREVGEHASGRDVTVVLEPEPEKYLRTPEQTVELIEELGADGFAACADLSHAVALDATTREYMEGLGRHLAHVHLDDGEYGLHPHRHQVPGRGEADLRDALEYLEESGFDGWVSVELNQHTENPASAAAEAAGFLRESGLREMFTDG
ncbi:MAG: hypothetical protein MAG715_00662 [Methanonatronarchaeales archaeon]|nr:hypothetical protein [Methanonatronarchaeales archaeon]